jgi:hypothetical protein
MSHANALLTPKGRLRLARCIVEDRWPLRRAAERFQVSVTTAARWAARYRALGEAGMTDRSSRPVSSPRRTSVRRERRIIAIRVNRRWGTGTDRLSGGHPSLHGAPCAVEVRAGEAGVAGPGHGPGDRGYEHHSPGDLATSTSRNSDGSRTAADTAASAGPSETGTRPVPRATGDRATLSCTTPSMTIPGSPTRRP